MRLRLPVPAALLTNRARRAGAALCLALALLTWLSPSSHTSPAPIVVPPGMVAASTAVYADAVAFVHDGDRIDLIEPTGGMTGASGPSATSSAPITPVVVAHGVEGLRLRITGGVGGEPRTAQLLVAAPSDVAAAIAAHQGSQVLAAIGASP